MFKALTDIAGDALKVVDAVVTVPVRLARIVTKPAADAATFVKESIEELVDEVTKE